MAAVVLDQIDLEGKIVTADALHTVKATANHIHERGGEFVLPVKENRRALFDALDALPWDQVPVAHTATDKGHGRITTRTIQVLPAPDDLPFPHVSQVFLIERYVTGLRGEPVSAVPARHVSRPLSHIPQPIRATAGSPPGPSRSCPLPMTCRSRTSARCSSSSGTSPACAASRSRPSPRSASRVRKPGGQAPPTWPATSASNGRSNPCTGSATPFTKRTNHRSGPGTDQESWRLCEISRSAPSGWPDARTSPKPPDGPDASWTGPLPSSDSHHDLGTAVGPPATR